MLIFENLIDTIKDQEIFNFKSWIYTVAKNHCLMKLRKEKSIAGKEEDYKKLITSKVVELSEEIHLINDKESKDIFDKLEKAIKSLKREQQICIKMLYLQNKTYAEVSEMTGYTMKQVKSYVQNGKRNLRNYLKK